MSLYVQDLSGCLESAIGAAGLTSSEQSVLLGEAKQVLNSLQRAIKDHRLPFATMGEDTAAIVSRVEFAYEQLANGARTIMFFGCGDAGLIGQAIAQYGGWGIPGVMVGTQKQLPVTRFYSSLDPVAISGALSRADLDRTRFVFVSESGDTSTVYQAIAALEAVRQRGHENAIPNLFLFVTGASASGAYNGLDQLGQHYGIPRITLPSDIGESFSGLTASGLLPAIARGLDVRKILEGASVSVVEFLAAQNSDETQPAQAAVVTVGLQRYRNCRQLIIAPFDDRLSELARYSLHLNSCSDESGAAVQTGSLCQGPQERARLERAIKSGNSAQSCLTLLHAAPKGQGPTLPADLAAIGGLSSVAATCLGDVAARQLETLAQLSREHGQPVREICLRELNETTLGAFLMDMMLEAVFIGQLARNCRTTAR